MVDQTVAARGIQDSGVLRALRVVPRHRFVPSSLASRAYDDSALPLEHGQTISQPYVVALMTELTRARPGDRVLEIGTGSGYQTAVLAECGFEVYTVEIVEPLARSARLRLEELGYRDIHYRVGDGREGWPSEAPFAAILAAAAPAEVPTPLLEQLALGGRLVIPVGEGEQLLMVYSRTPDGFHQEVASSVRFVPMTSEDS